MTRTLLLLTPLVAVLLACGQSRRCPSFTDETPLDYATKTIIELHPSLREAVTKVIERRLEVPRIAEMLGMKGNGDLSVTLYGETLGDRFTSVVRREDGSYHYTLIDVNFQLSDPENGGGEAWVTISEDSKRGCYVDGVVIRDPSRVYE